MSKFMFSFSFLFSKCILYIKYFISLMFLIMNSTFLKTGYIHTGLGKIMTKKLALIFSNTAVLNAF